MDNRQIVGWIATYIFGTIAKENFHIFKSLKDFIFLCYKPNKNLRKHIDWEERHPEENLAR